MATIVYGFFSALFAYLVFLTAKFSSALWKSGSPEYRFWQTRRVGILRVLQVGMPLMAIALVFGVLGNVLLLIESLMAR